MSKACTYGAYLVGKGLRPAKPRLGLSSEMCVPIQPNTADHPTRRPALRAKPDFPFSGCCVWSGADVELHVRIKGEVDSGDEGEDGRGEDAGVHSVYLAPSESIALHGMRGEDRARARAMVVALEVEEEEKAAGRELLARDAQEAVATPPRSFTQDAAEKHGGNRSSRSASSSASSTASGSDSGHSGSTGSSDDTLSDDDASWCSSEDSSERGSVLSFYSRLHDENPGCLPTIRVWSDLATHLTSEDIPDPLAFAEQYRAVTECVFYSFACRPF